MKFQKGDKVAVVKRGLYTSGREGVVIGPVENSKCVWVKINGLGNMAYSPYSLKLISRENNNTDNKGENVMLIGKYKVCAIKFIEGSNTTTEYNYALYDSNINVGDYVVVKSANHGMGIATITNIIADENVTDAMRNYCNGGREVVAKFDMSTYNERIEKRKMAKQLKADMSRKMKEMQELAMFELMAEKNPELKEMLETYKELIQ